MAAFRRLFLALWPSTPLRNAIVERCERSSLQEALGGRRVPTHNLHLTLVFLGNVPAERVDALCRGIDRLEVNGQGVLRLDRFGIFPAARVAWLGADPVPPALHLHELLKMQAADLGLSVDARPWRPHVTLLRRIRRQRARPPGELRLRDPGALASTLDPTGTPIEWPMAWPIDWPMRSFSLIESIQGRPYQVLRTWPVE